MRGLLLLSLLFSGAASADLYRWVDPQSGSVKFSSVPPPWLGDADREAVSPKVEVIVPQLRPAPTPAPAAAAAAPGKPPAPPPPGAKPAPPGPLDMLQQQWRSRLQAIAGLPQGADFNRAGQGLQQQLKDYEAVRAELDRLDPAGAARRTAEEGGLLERLRKGIEAQFSPGPPVR